MILAVWMLIAGTEPMLYWSPPHELTYQQCMETGQSWVRAQVNTWIAEHGIDGRPFTARFACIDLAKALHV